MSTSRASTPRTCCRSAPLRAVDTNVHAVSPRVVGNARGGGATDGGAGIEAAWGCGRQRAGRERQGPGPWTPPDWARAVLIG